MATVDTISATRNVQNNAAPPRDPSDGGTALDRLMAAPSALDGVAPPRGYRVEAGDTLSAIAEKFGTNWQTLARINGIANPDRIAVDQTIRLPQGAQAAPSTHRVAGGETLSGIAAAAGTNWQSIARLNNIANPDLIRPGQELKLPGGTTPDVQTVRPTTETPTTETRTPAQQSGGNTAPQIGSVSERYESSGRGPGTVSTGAGDPGGVSYGVYQLSSNAGTLQAFLRNEGRGYAAELGGGIGGATFNANWKAIAAREPDAFRAAQHAFIERTHYSPAIDTVRDATGLDLSTRHAAVQEATWSTSVQHGRAPQLLQSAIERTDAQVGRNSAEYDRTLVSNIYAERSAYLNRLADSGNYTPREAEQLRSITQNRYPNERRDVLALFDQAQAPARTGRTEATQPAGNARDAADFANIVNAQGNQQARDDLAAGRKVLVAVRSDSSTAANNNRGEYNDRMALVWRQSDGSYRAQTFDGNTEPAGVYAARGYGNDVDGDGRRELGRLVEGSYRYELQSGNFAGNRFFRATETQAALRDSNHDGRFTRADQVDRAGAGRSLLIHQGGTSSTGSAGCQTLRPADFNALLGGLGGQSRFSYVLVNGGG